MQSSALRAYQPSLSVFCDLSEAVETLASAGAEERGAIFTRPEVVEFILDLVGYTADKPLHQLRLLEPSFGGGDFLFGAVRRLISSYRASGRADVVDDLRRAICAVELHRSTFQTTAAALLALLLELGVATDEARALSEAWLMRDDFLLADIAPGFDFVVGNPPYIRQELIPQPLIDEYRRRFATVYDRADIYIPFIERSLTLLAERGALSFICADRWMKNRYGGPLRRFVADRFHLRACVDMVDTPAFLSEVVAYPAIFVIANERGNVTRLAHRPPIEASALKDLALAMMSNDVPHAGVKEVGVVTQGNEPWLLEAFDNLAIVRRLESQYPALEDAGCKVGIGVATGADEAFIGKLDELDVEDDRKLPLVMTRDILSGVVQWRGYGVINPFRDEGGLVDLADHPRLGRYLEAHRQEIAGRHVAKKAPANWYRTIDRIYPPLVTKPKLLIPDIKGAAHIVFDEGHFYPHHNLYFITSDVWDLRALQAVLLSGIAKLFIAAYSTKMRGGYLRFQAQYLRRIRVPHWKDISASMKERLVNAGTRADQVACNDAVAELYGLTPSERELLGMAREPA